MRTREELKDLAFKLYRNEIFTSLQFQEGDLQLAPQVFMPLALMSRKAIDKLINNGVSVLYAEVRDATGRTVNGYPIFRSLSYLTQDEARVVLEYHEKIKKALDGID